MKQNPVLYIPLATTFVALVFAWIVFQRYQQIVIVIIMILIFI
jgi:hypothetical protein